MKNILNTECKERIIIRLKDLINSIRDDIYKFKKMTDDIQEFTHKERTIIHLKDLVNSIRDDIYEFKGLTDDIQGLLEDFSDDRK